MTEIVVRQPDGSTRPATREDHLDLLGVPQALRHQPPPVTVNVHSTPLGFWQSMPCTECGAAVGHCCQFPEGPSVSNVHKFREIDVMGEAALDVIRGALARQQAAAAAKCPGGRQ